MASGRTTPPTLLLVDWPGSDHEALLCAAVTAVSPEIHVEVLAPCLDLPERMERRACEPDVGAVCLPLDVVGASPTDLLTRRLRRAVAALRQPVFAPASSLALAEVARPCPRGSYSSESVACAIAAATFLLDGATA